MAKISTAADTKELGLTIYNGGFGLVKEKRRLNFDEYDPEIIYADVAQRIETDSLVVEGLNVLEFNYDYDLANREKLLLKYIGREVTLRERKTGARKNCRLLSVEGGGSCVFEDVESKEIYLDTAWEIILPSLPSGLLVKPALVWKSDGKPAGEVQVSYLSGGFRWAANYVVELKDKSLRIVGWAEIENNSGMTYTEAKVKLIAGDVNRAFEDEPVYGKRLYLTVEEAAPQAEEKAFFDYHMYTLRQTTTLKDNQTKQVCLLTANRVPFTQYYCLNFNKNKAEVVVELCNDRQSGLGLAIPKGKVKVYKEDEADGSLEFIGEDWVEHTPKDEEIKLVVGSAFDLVYDYKEVDHKKISGYEHHVCQCVIRNHKETQVEVRFEPTIWGLWEMVDSSHEYNKKSSGKLEYRVVVPAEGAVTVRFEYRVDRRREFQIKQ